MGFLVEESNRDRGRVRNFCLEGQVTALIYLSRQPPHTHTYIYTHAFLLYIHIYIHTPKGKKKNLVFSIKIMFDSGLS